MHSHIYKRSSDEKNDPTHFHRSDHKSGAEYISEKSTCLPDSDKASVKKSEPKRFYSSEKRDLGIEHVYYSHRHTLTDAKQKQDSYAHSQQVYQRKDRVVGSAAPQGTIYPTNVGANIDTVPPPQDLTDRPPDYDSLPPPYPKQ